MRKNSGTCCRCHKYSENVNLVCIWPNYSVYPNDDHILCDDCLAELRKFLKGEPDAEKSVETNIFDIVEEYEDCTVQVLKNSITGETSVGWHKNN